MIVPLSYFFHHSDFSLAADDKNSPRKSEILRQPIQMHFLTFLKKDDHDGLYISLITECERRG